MDIVILLGGVAVALGTVASAGYYFARYLIKTDDEKAIAESKQAAAVEAAQETTAEDAQEATTKAAQKTTTETKETHAPATVTPIRPGAELKTEPRTAIKTEPKAAPVDKIAPVEPSPKPSLNQALRGTRDSFWGKIQKSLLGGGQIESAQLEVLEEILYTSDLGTTTVTRLLDSVEGHLSKQEKKSLDVVKTSLKSEVETILNSVPKMGRSPFENFTMRSKPQVWMIVGVNGAGKTTTIGKLAHIAAQQGAKVLVAAGDTFRAAAQSQLKVWSERAQVEIFSPEGVTDPGAVAFDAVKMAAARGYDLVLIDTAGRLHTQENLMEELKKVKRVIQKLNPEAPHETLIVLDANSGQNALVQAQKFHETLKLSGAVFTKMDGTAKGGVVLGLASQLQIPTVFLGVGESMDALTSFNPNEFAEGLFESH